MADLKPFLKWAGGKRKLAQRISDLFRTTLVPAYGEPFLGGGAVFLHLLQRERASVYVVSDANPEVVNLWRVVRDHPEALLRMCGQWPNDERTYYEVRDEFRPETPLERAAYMLWLNRHCFNGLYRLNRSGKYNVPFGRYKNPSIDADNLRRVSAALKDLRVIILEPADFTSTFRALEHVEGACVYCDPPYWPVSATANFTAYTGKPFEISDQHRLLDYALKWWANDQSRQVVISNSAAEPVLTVYSRCRHDLLEVTMGRAINSDASKRAPVKEVLLHIHEGP